MVQTLVVFVAGGVGSALRFLVSGRVQSALGSAFPYATIFINLTGSFLISLFMVLSLRSTSITTNLRLMLTTGLCGGYTTYSTFNYETLTLMNQGAWTRAALNVGITLVGAIAAGVLGGVVGNAVAP